MNKIRYNRLLRAASTLLIIAMLLPMFFGGVRSVEAVGIIYVDDSWVGTTPGDDPDGAGPATNFGTESFAKIQEGVNAVDAGGTVTVNAGTYTEQVLINKTITLTGEDKTTTIIQAFPAMTLNCMSELLQNRPVVCINNGSNPTVQGFTIDGLLLGDSNPRLIGIAVHEAGGVIQKNIIKNTRFAALNSAPEGVGVYVYNTDTTVRTVSILENSISNFNKNGITVTTSDNSQNPTEFVIARNTIAGTLGLSGLHNSTVAQNGIQVQVPFGSGRIQENIISNIAYNNAPTQLDPEKLPLVGVSILNFSTPVDTIDNIITNAQVGILYHNSQDDPSGGGLIDNNQIEVFKPGTGTNPGRNVYGILITDRPKDLLSPLDPVQLPALKASLNWVALPVTTISNNSILYTGTLDEENTYGIEVDAGFNTNDQTVAVLKNVIGTPGMGFDKGLAFYQCNPDNPPYPPATCDTGTITDLSQIISNNISGNYFGVVADGPIGNTYLDDFHHNRIVGNQIGVHNTTGYGILLQNNWWGCNGGPGATGCDTAENVLSAFADPWLVLTTSVDPANVLPGGTSTLTADLNYNNLIPAGVTAGYVMDGIPVTFSVKTQGSVNPTSGATLLGESETTFTAPLVGGTFQVCATVDNEEVCSDVTEDPPLMVFLPLIFK